MSMVKAEDKNVAEAKVDDPSAKDAELVRHWSAEITAALKREKDFRKDGDDVVELYEGGKKRQYQFNILYSNTETLAPALYNSTPRPVVQRRFKDSDPLGAKASLATQRVLEFLTDSGNQDYSPFDDQMKSAVLEGLVPGRGITRFSYQAEFETIVRDDVQAPVSGDNGPDAIPDAQGSPDERVTFETAVGEEVPWNRFLHGYAKKWSGVPWVGFEHLMTREELVEAFGPIGNTVPLTSVSSRSDSDERGAQGKSDDPYDAKVELGQVYEIWSKKDRQVLFIAPSCLRKPLKVEDDPLKLTGFFPCPKPITFLAKINTLTPRALYTMYEEQANELNAITVRINKIIRALKVRGGYDSTVEGIEAMMKADDNEMVPIQNITALDARGATLEKALWLIPIEKLIVVVQQLYIARQQAKQVIYEITGIADIMRGASVASETLGAQELKNQWGTLRLKRAQKEVMRYTRDCLRIMAEIAVSKFSPQTLRAMTGLPYPTGDEKAQAQQFLQMAQQQAIQSGMPPEVMQQKAQSDPQIQQAMKVAGEASWEEILAVLQNDLVRAYRIDIETNSTIDAEATEDKKDITELLTAISQFLQGIGPLIQDGTMPFAVAQQFLLTIVRKFRFGTEVEEQLKGMQAPQPKPDPKAEQMKQQAEIDKQSAMLDAQGKQQDLEVKKQLAQLEIQVAQMELQLKQQEFQLKQAETGLKLRAMNQKAQIDERAMHNEAQAGEHMLSLRMRTQAAQAEAAINKAKAPPPKPTSARRN